MLTWGKSILETPKPTTRNILVYINEEPIRNFAALVLDFKLFSIGANSKQFSILIYYKVADKLLIFFWKTTLSSSSRISSQYGNNQITSCLSISNFEFHYAIETWTNTNISEWLGYTVVVTMNTIKAELLHFI